VGVQVRVARSFELEQLELLTAEDMREIGLLAREMIVSRTRFRQVGADGQPFQGLSPKYADYKHKSVGGIPKPDLTLSGAMLNDLTIVEVRVDRERAAVVLGFTK
jgi:hypothetical protein